MSRKINLFIVNLLIFVNCESRSLIQEDRNSTQGTNINLISNRDEFKSENVYQNQKYDYDEIELFLKRDCKNKINKCSSKPELDTNSQKCNYELCKKILLDIKNYKFNYPYITRKRMRADCWCKYTFCNGSLKPIIYKNEIESLSIIYNDDFLKFINHEYTTSRYNFDKSVQKYIYQNLYVLYNRIKASYNENYFKKRTTILKLYTNNDHISNLIFQFIDKNDEFSFLNNKYSKPILDKIILAFIVIGIKEYFDKEYEGSLYLSEEEFIQYLSAINEFLNGNLIYEDLKKFNLREKLHLGVLGNNFGEEGVGFSKSSRHWLKLRGSYCSINNYPLTAYDQSCFCDLFTIFFFIFLIFFGTLLIKSFGAVYILMLLQLLLLYLRCCLGIYLPIRPVDNLFRKICCLNSKANFAKMKEKIIDVIINSERIVFLIMSKNGVVFYQKLLIKTGLETQMIKKRGVEYK